MNMFFPIPIIIQIRSKEQTKKFAFEPEVAKQLYADYRALLRNFFSQYNLHEWTGQMTTDPWSPGLHYLCRTEKRRFLRLVPYNQEVAVAEIESEPRFAEQDMDTLRLRYDGLEVRVIDTNTRPLIDEFCKQYTQRFNEQPKIV